MTTRYLTLLAIISLCAHVLRAQSDGGYSKVMNSQNIDAETLDGLHKKYDKLQSEINKRSEKLLSSMQAKEDKLRRKLNHTDSTKAAELFNTDVKQHYSDLNNNLAATADKVNKFPLKEYVAGLDSMQTSLTFLLQNPNLPTDKLQQLQSLSMQVQSLESQLQKANDIKAFVQERVATLKEQLMNTSLGKQVTGINKQVYYYQERLAEYKAMLDDKEKMKDKILETVRTFPAFQPFFQKYSFFAALFPASTIDNGASTFTGLQTRSSIQTLLAQRVGSAGGTAVSPQQYFQGQVNEAQTLLSQVKDKLNQFGGGGSSEMTMPDFKPNEQKTKSFFQRFEYGFNLQNQPSYYSLPMTTDFALSVGYKLSNTKKLGIGASYKMGWGSSIKDIQLSSQGVGLRSYVDVKAKKSIWLTGGFEYNYMSAFTNIEDLQNSIDIWQKSALLGLSKKYSIGKNKEGNMQLLYDLLHGQQNPPSPALKFRLGYTF
jgi:hypothetical protein